MKALLLLCVGCLLFPVCAVAQGVRGFGTPAGKLPVKGFGNPAGEEALRQQFPVAAASIIAVDRQMAQSQISRTDANGDGVTTKAEWEASGYQTPRHFFYHDLNGDGRLTHYEHSIGVARWRRRHERNDENRTSAQRAAAKKPEPVESLAATSVPEAIDPQVEARRRQVWDLAGYVLRVHDTNSDGVIQRSEFGSSNSAFGNLSSADTDNNGDVRRQELAKWLEKRLPPLSKLSLQFQSRDADKNGQVTLREYAPDFTDSDVAEFRAWDRNGDGFVTPRESRNPPPPAQSEFVSEQTLVLKPNATIVSQLWIEQDHPISDLKVHAVISKENDNFTEVILVSPGGRQVVLYAGDGWLPWQGALILKGVTFDDQAPEIRQTLRQPPWPRQLRPPGVGQADAESLQDLNGGSTRGTWRLIVRNQNDRVGLLVRWSLTNTPEQGTP